MEETLLAQATSVLDGLSVAGNQAGYNSNLSFTTLVANVINAILGFTGVAFVLLLVYSGIMYMTAQGEDDRVKRAKRLISTSVIGILIIVAAYALAKFIFAALATATAPGT